MAVEKMHFLSVAGPIEQLDRIMLDSIAPYNIQLVDIYSHLDETVSVNTFNDINPYDVLLKKMDELFAYEGIKMDWAENAKCHILSLKDVQVEIDEYSEIINLMQKELNEARLQLVKEQQIKSQIEPLKDLDIEVDKFFNFKFMKFRFGKMPKDNYAKVVGYLENQKVIIRDVRVDNDDVFLMYFTPSTESKSIDDLFNSLYFERIRISDEVKGLPEDALKMVDQKIKITEEIISDTEAQFKDYFKLNLERLKEIYLFLSQLNRIFEAQKNMVYTKKAVFIAGWIPDSSVQAFESNLELYRGVTCMVEGVEEVKKIQPPTKLINEKFFRPFEALVEMYGTPSYHELDPTKFVALTYILMFGLMFGDLGQGLVIAAVGFYLYKKKGVALAKLMIYLGAVSAVFGTYYGSLFGNEEVLREYLSFIPMMNPMENINMVLLSAIGFGVFMLIMAMVLNLVNAWRVKNVSRFFFDRNGVAGLVFYVALLFFGLRMFNNQSVPVVGIIVLIVLPLLVIFFAHPLDNLIKGADHFLPKDKGGFIIETSFEIIETLLAFASNTLSFIRVGAFALNHVGFFMAFHMLGEMVGGTASVFVMIFGNILIIILEGMIVAIQGLRLEFYELFSRFFSGDGIEFKPFKING